MLQTLWLLFSLHPPGLKIGRIEEYITSFWLNFTLTVCKIQLFTHPQISRLFCATPHTVGGPYWSNIYCQQVSVQVRVYACVLQSLAHGDDDDDAKADWFTDTDVLVQLVSHPRLLLLITAYSQIAHSLTSVYLLATTISTC